MLTRIYLPLDIFAVVTSKVTYIFACLQALISSLAEAFELVGLVLTMLSLTFNKMNMLVGRLIIFYLVDE